MGQSTKGNIFGSIITETDVFYAIANFNIGENAAKRILKELDVDLRGYKGTACTKKISVD